MLPSGDRINCQTTDQPVLLFTRHMLGKCLSRWKWLWYLLPTALLFSSAVVAAEEKIDRVALIANSPRLSYTDETGKFTGFNVEIATELCTSMRVRCVQHPVLASQIVDEAAADQLVRPLGLNSTVLSGPLITGALHMVISPKQAELVERIDAALDQTKRDGRFDRINTKFVPFSLL